MNHLSKEEFLVLSHKGNLIPVYKEILGDFLTPTSAYLHLAKKTKYSFLLESVEGGEKFARFSFIARDPSLIIRAKGNKVEIIRTAKAKSKVEKKEIKSSPLEIVRELMKAYKAVDVPQLPRFYGGLVGFLSYDCVRFFERLPQKTEDDLKLPDMVMALAENLVIFDHRHHTIKVVSCVHLGPEDSQA
ncbi:MAG: anthranilate synthase component I, partial [Candidatus Omnitrophota bacterium]